MNRSLPAIFLASLALAAPATASDAALHPGAVELGFAGSLDRTDTSTEIAAAVRSGLFLDPGSGLLGLELDVTYQHLREYDTVDALTNFSWSWKGGDTAIYPFLAATFGVRNEWVGSFRQSFFPTGATLGIRALAGQRATFRFEYRVLHVLDDPIENTTEHHLLVGISVLFRNAGA